MNLEPPKPGSGADRRRPRQAPRVDPERPPPSPLRPIAESIHGITVTDPFRWLEDVSAPEVGAWLAGQRQYARSVLDRLPARAAIVRRLEQVMDTGAIGPWVPRGARRFRLSRRPGRNQAALMVEDEAGERELVDPERLTGDSTASIDWWYPSTDGRLVAVGVSEAGDEKATLRLLEAGSGALLADRIPACQWPALAWEPAGGAFLYSRGPAPGSVPAGEEGYHRHVFRHVVGTDPAGDLRVWGEGRDKLDFPARLSISEDGAWCVLTVSQGTLRTAVFLGPPEGPLRPVFEGVDAHLDAWFAGDRLYGLTDLGSPNQRLVEIDPAHPGPETWRDLIADSDQVLVEVAVTSDRLVAHRLARACSRLSVHRLDGEFEREVEVPEFSTVTGVGAHFGSRFVHLTYESFTTPTRAARLDPATGRLEAEAGLSVPDRFDATRYPVRQEVYTSADGTPITIFLVGRESGPGPTLLTGYGGFRIARTPLWTPTLVPFLEAGGLVALPNLRGGGEYGENWHRAGMLGRKQNVFDDFLAAAEWLRERGLAGPAQLGIMGGSNGGLLVAAAMTQRPEYFRAVVCRVPLIDMLRYEGFKVARLWVSEYGSAADPEGFAWLFAYSPYHRVRPGRRYPDTLITTGEEDARVDPMHARKFAAILQVTDPEAVTLLRVEPRAGHGLGKPVAKLVPEEADVLAFLLDRLSG